jgi:hypothetical protein
MKIKKYKPEISVKKGDNLTVAACYFQPGWRGYAPCFLFSPILVYDEVNSCEGIIEDFLINLCAYGTMKSDDDEEEYVDEQLKWAGKSLKSCRQNISNALKTNKKPYKEYYSEIIVMEVEIIEDLEGAEEGDLTWKVLNKIEI